ncbi:MAG: PEP-CTERM sorting domain-containing protein [Burkholderiales bacterium]|jgi:hypothetical protein|nr:PEP-CTERM sorting domain-containing protein [Burkholderiales bacterium]
MNSKIQACAATLLAAAAPLALAANVATGASVVTTGSGFGLSAGWGVGTPAAPSSLVDGAFVADGQQWNLGTVYWQGGSSDSADTITISLAHAATVTGLLLQGDNNDSYVVSYEALDGTWHTLPDAFSPHGSVADPGAGTVAWGMGVSAQSFAAITAQAFRVDASGDQSYAVSEFQATGQFLPTVPEPTSTLLLLAGLGALGITTRRRARH